MNNLTNEHVECQFLEHGHLIDNDHIYFIDSVVPLVCLMDGQGILVTMDRDLELVVNYCYNTTKLCGCCYYRCN